MLDLKCVPLSGLPDVKILYTKKPYRDERGTFSEVYREKDMAEYLGTEVSFVQGNLTYSEAGAVRGMHYQTAKPQGKLMRTVSGVTFNAAVDMREGSPTFGQSASCLLNNGGMALWVPPGFANGFLSMTQSVVMYECSAYHYAGSDTGVRFDDPDLGIPWPLMTYIISDKDKHLPIFKDAKLVPATECVA